MGVEHRTSLTLGVFGAAAVILLSAATYRSEQVAEVLAAEPEIVETEALLPPLPPPPVSLPMPSAAELRQALRGKNLDVEAAAARIQAVEPPEPLSSVEISPPTTEELLEKYVGREEILEPEELRELLELTGFEGEGLRMAWAVAMRESRAKPTAFNGNLDTGDTSYGLFQINMLGYLGRHRAELYGLDEYEDLFDPVTNAAVAFEMSEEGTDFGPWCIGPNAYNGCRVGDYPYWLTQFPEDEDANG